MQARAARLRLAKAAVSASHTTCMAVEGGGVDSGLMGGMRLKEEMKPLEETVSSK